MSKNNLNKFSRRLFIKSGLVGLSTPLLSKSFDLKLDKVEPPLSTSDKDWKSIRSHFIIDKNISYMNNASLGMPPLSVVQSINKGYQSISKEPLHGKHDLQNHISEFVIPQLANTFGVGSKEIVLTRNASEALDIQAHSINLERGDEILISSQEHPAGLRPWLVRQKNDGIKLKKVFIPSPLISVSDTLSRISDAITSKTKAISFCHVTRGGHLYPVKEIVKMAKNRNLLTLIISKKLDVMHILLVYISGFLRQQAQVFYILIMKRKSVLHLLLYMRMNPSYLALTLQVLKIFQLELLLVQLLTI